VRRSYEEIGRGYARVRRPDPRIGALIDAALGSARSVINIGAGAGAYEPLDRNVTAVEPSEVMISQRPPRSAPVVQASAESLPFPDGAFDVALAVLTVHHWADIPAGIREMRRVARRQVILTWDQAVAEQFWLARDYLPETALFYRQPELDLVRLRELLGSPTEVRIVPIPHDCTDGFQGAYWRRPGAYLDPAIRAGISTLAILGERAEPGLLRLKGDLESGAWAARYAHLMNLDEIDLGYRRLITR
jgi:SAM-dependent methyltransferase